MTLYPKCTQRAASPLTLPLPPQTLPGGGLSNALKDGINLQNPEKIP